MQWVPLDIKDKELFDEFIDTKNILVSDINFTNLYLWHYSREISYCILNDCLVIQTKYPNQDPFVFYPISKNNNKEQIKKTILELIDFYRANNILFSMHSLSIDDKDELLELMPDVFEYIFREDRSDYIYSIKELIELKGKKYHKKKTHINRFNERYKFSYEIINPNNVHEVIDVYSQWFNKMDNVSDGLKNEYVGIVESLKQIEKLKFIGCILRVDGEIIAFSFGEKLNKNTIVIHIEKANIDYQGSYQAVNREFLLREWSEFEFVNREEDLGIDGLRKAKQSYNPLYLQEKFDAVLRVDR